MKSGKVPVIVVSRVFIEISNGQVVDFNNEMMSSRSQNRMKLIGFPVVVVSLQLVLAFLVAFSFGIVDSFQPIITLRNSAARSNRCTIRKKSIPYFLYLDYFSHYDNNNTNTGFTLVNGGGGGGGGGLRTTKATSSTGTTTTSWKQTSSNSNEDENSSRQQQQQQYAQKRQQEINLAEQARIDEYLEFLDRRYQRLHDEEKKEPKDQQQNNVVSTSSTISKSNKIMKQQQQQQPTAASTTSRRFRVLKWLVESLDEEEEKEDEGNIGDSIDKRNDALYVFGAAGLAGKRLLRQQQKDDNNKKQQHHKEQQQHSFHHTTSSLSPIQKENDAFAIRSRKESQEQLHQTSNEGYKHNTRRDEKVELVSATKSFNQLILSFCIDSPIYQWIFHIQQQRYPITSILFFLANVSSKNNYKKGNNVVTKAVNVLWVVGGGKRNRRWTTNVMTAYLLFLSNSLLVQQQVQESKQQQQQPDLITLSSVPHIMSQHVRGIDDES